MIFSNKQHKKKNSHRWKISDFLLFVGFTNKNKFGKFLSSRLNFGSQPFFALPDHYLQNSSLTMVVLILNLALTSSNIEKTLSDQR